jgi:hypothetical protein
MKPQGETGFAPLTTGKAASTSPMPSARAGAGDEQRGPAPAQRRNAGNRNPAGNELPRTRRRMKPCLCPTNILITRQPAFLCST